MHALARQVYLLPSVISKNPKCFFTFGDAGRPTVVPSPAKRRKLFHVLGVHDSICVDTILFSPRKKFSFILKRAIEKAAPVTGFASICESRVSRLYSAEFLKRLSTKSATEENGSLQLRVKSFSLEHTSS